MTIPAFCRPCGLCALLLAVIPFFTGCGSKEEIRSYPVPKEAQQATTAPVAQGEATDRMMGAILPAGQQTWYFKVVGPIAEMDKNAEQITAFFNTIRISPGDAKPEWKAPEGWQEEGATGMRAATLMVPAEGKPLEMTVIALPSTGAPGELLDNVNRWRGQLQLPPMTERDLAADVKQVQVGDASMAIVDMRGRFSGGMTAPFAGGGPFSGGARPPMDAPFAGGAGQGDKAATESGQAPPELPPGHPPVDSRGGPVDPSAAAPFTYTTPDGWQEQPATGMRKAAFKVTDGGTSAEVTVIDLAASAPNVADPLANLNRWRGEVGLGPIQAEDLEGKVEKIEVSGAASDYLEAIPDTAKPQESEAKEATVAAIVPAGDSVWFFKLRGDRELVAAQRENFKKFLESVEFKLTDGEGDGNQ